MSNTASNSVVSNSESALGKTANFLVLGALLILLMGSVLEFYNIASGTGRWYAATSPKWFAALVVFSGACLAVFMACLIGPWRRSCASFLLDARARLARFRAPLVVILILLPIVLLQYTLWGAVLRGPYLRVLLWAVTAIAVAWLLCDEGASVLAAKSLFAAALLSGSAIVIACAFTYVTSYPFSLGWSEGNRLWDYSLLFGTRFYSFDPGNPPVAYLDIGRQVIGGLPFLLPRVSIEGARAWLALVSTLPHILLGFLAFFPKRPTQSKAWIPASLFSLVFLSQGPIHAPLVICAILVLLAWRLPTLWGAILLTGAGYFAESSRFTWMFAPAMYSVMLELGGAVLQGRRLPMEAWRRAGILGGFGLLGSALALSNLVPWKGTSVASSAAVSTSQALLWYRLLPNATYGDGILLGLLKATGPLLVVMVFAWLAYWRRGRLQVFVIAASLLAFLIVGLVVSTKIGGGGDLHNLDMFLVGLLLTAALIWQDVGEVWLKDLSGAPKWIHSVAVLSMVIPAYSALLSLQPLSFAAEVEWISVLAGADRPRDLGSLPDGRTIEASLDKIHMAVAAAAPQGQVLFMDQRQLLTFGYVEGVELVPEYEKKRLMDEALSGNRAYFTPFYQDLAEGRFSLIVSSPLRTPIKDNQYGFGEENNAWVQWVAKPVLCYYEAMDTLNEAKVELLVPKKGHPNCASVLPGGLE